MIRVQLALSGDLNHLSVLKRPKCLSISQRSDPVFVLRPLKSLRGVIFALYYPITPKKYVDLRFFVNRI